VSQLQILEMDRAFVSLF